MNCHAELNALLAVNLQAIIELCISGLYTIMEHACVGAFYMSGSQLALCGAMRMPRVNLLDNLILSTSQFASHTPMIRAWDIVIGLNLELILSTYESLSPLFIQIWRDAVPRGVALGERLFESKLLSQMRTEQYNW